MQNEDRFYMLRFACSAVAFGMIFWVLIGAAIILAAANLPEPSADGDGTLHVFWGVLVVSASLLATAPLIQWWHNALKWIFQIS